MNGLIDLRQERVLERQEDHGARWLVPDPFEHATPTRATDIRIAARRLIGLRNFIRPPYSVRARHPRAVRADDTAPAG